MNFSGFNYIDTYEIVEEENGKTVLAVEKQWWKTIPHSLNYNGTNERCGDQV